MYSTDINTICSVFKVTVLQNVKQQHSDCMEIALILQPDGKNEVSVQPGMWNLLHNPVNKMHENNT